MALETERGEDVNRRARGGAVNAGSGEMKEGGDRWRRGRKQGGPVIKEPEADREPSKGDEKTSRTRRGRRGQGC